MFTARDVAINEGRSTSNPTNSYFQREIIMTALSMHQPTIFADLSIPALLSFTPESNGASINICLSLGPDYEDVATTNFVTMVQALYPLLSDDVSTLRADMVRAAATLRNLAAEMDRQCQLVDQNAIPIEFA